MPWMKLSSACSQLHSPPKLQSGMRLVVDGVRELWDRSEEQVETIVECIKIMRSLDQFSIPDGILREIAQEMQYDVYRMRDRIIMEGDEMKGLFKLCLAGIMQTDIDEYKNAVYLETAEYFCEEMLRPHIRNNPEPLVMMVAKHNTHIVTFTPEHYNQYIKPCMEQQHKWKQT